MVVIGHAACCYCGTLKNKRKQFGDLKYFAKRNRNNQIYKMQKTKLTKDKTKLFLTFSILTLSVCSSLTKRTASAGKASSLLEPFSDVNTPTSSCSLFTLPSISSNLPSIRI